MRNKTCPCFRNKEIRKMKRSMRDGNSFAFICNDINNLEHSIQLKLPRVSVVMPLKGFGEHNLQNWRSQVNTNIPLSIFPCSYVILEILFLAIYTFDFNITQQVINK